MTRPSGILYVAALSAIALWAPAAASILAAPGQESTPGYEDGVAAFRRHDYPEALRRWQAAAEKGDLMSQKALGVAYYTGEGVAKDPTIASQWFRKAAEQGDMQSAFHLGGLYCAGEGVAKDFSQGNAWIRKAAEQGNADAQGALGAMYRDGQCGEKDLRQAVLWLRKAADNGLTVAQIDLAALYSQGRGVPVDQGEAARWVRKAAEAGDREGQYSLGAMYAEAQGVPKDAAQAEAWLQKAADQGYEPARRKLHELKIRGVMVQFQGGFDLQTSYTSPSAYFTAYLAGFGGSRASVFEVGPQADFRLVDEKGDTFDIAPSTGAFATADISNSLLSIARQRHEADAEFAVSRTPGGDPCVFSMQYLTEAASGTVVGVQHVLFQKQGVVFDISVKAASQTNQRRAGRLAKKFMTVLWKAVRFRGEILQGLPEVSRRFKDPRHALVTEVAIETARALHCKLDLVDVGHQNVLWVSAGGRLKGNSLFIVLMTRDYTTGLGYLASVARGTRLDFSSLTSFQRKFFTRLKKNLRNERLLFFAEPALDKPLADWVASHGQTIVFAGFGPAVSLADLAPLLDESTRQVHVPGVEVAVHPPVTLMDAR